MGAAHPRELLPNLGSFDQEVELPCHDAHFPDVTSTKVKQGSWAHGFCGKHLLEWITPEGSARAEGLARSAFRASELILPGFYSWSLPGIIRMIPLARMAGVLRLLVKMSVLAWTRRFFCNFFMEQRWNPAEVLTVTAFSSLPAGCKPVQRCAPRFCGKVET